MIRFEQAVAFTFLVGRDACFVLSESWNPYCVKLQRIDEAEIEKLVLCMEIPVSASVLLNKGNMPTISDGGMGHSF